MAIKVNSGFKVGAPVPIDTRIVLSWKEMENINERIMPAVYFALCSDDNSFYLYSPTNTENAKTGKFKFMFGNSSELIDRARCIELIQQYAASKEDMVTAQGQLAAILANAPADCATFKEVSDKFELTPNTAITSEEISDIITGG